MEDPVQAGHAEASSTPGDGEASADRSSPAQDLPGSRPQADLDEPRGAPADQAAPTAVGVSAAGAALGAGAAADAGLPTGQPPMPGYSAPGYLPPGSGAPGYLPPELPPQPPGQPPTGLGPGGFPWTPPGQEGPDNRARDVPSLGARPRRRALTVVAVVLVVAILVGGGIAYLITSGPGPVPLVSPAARALLRASLSAAESKGSFHYVSRSTGQGMTQVTVGDAGRTSGKQVITIGSDTFTVLVLGTACYFQGDANAMTTQLGLPASVASAHSDQWISLAPGDEPYASVYAAVTTHSALADNIDFTPHRRLGPSIQSGRHVLGITGPLTNVSIAGVTQKAKGTAHLYIDAGRPHLPVLYQEKGKLNNINSNFSIQFSRFGEAFTVTAPSGAVAFSSLGGSGGGAPPGSSGGGSSLVST